MDITLTYYKTIKKRINIRSGVLFIMKCSIISAIVQLTFFGILQAGNANGQDLSQKVNLQLSQASIKESFSSIQKQSDIKFLYTEELLNSELKKVDLSAAQISVQEATTKILANTNLRYRLVDGYVVIETKPVPVKKQEPGKITGRVTDSGDGQPIVGASIRIGGKGTSTDTTGLYSIVLPSGSYSAEISYIGYNKKIVTGIVIKENRALILNIPLEQSQGVLSTVTVSSKRVFEAGSNVAVINEIRKADAVVSGISREQIMRSQDRDAAQVVRRIPGITVVENRFIVIRGLPQRYNSVLLNNVTSPSFEADSRAFSFETIPSGMIDRVMVYKTAMPELPGDFAGGVVKIFTTDIPRKNDFNITYQTSVRPNTTFRQFTEQKQGNTAWLGYDDGTYTGFFDRKEKTLRLDKLKEDEAGYWNPQTEKAPIDQRLNVNLAHVWKVAEKNRLAFVTGGSYSNTYQSTMISLNPGQASREVRKFVPFYTFSDNQQDHEVRVNGLANVSLELADGRHLIAFKNLYTHLGSFGVTTRNGISLSDAEDGIGFTENMLIRQQIQENAFKSIYNGQLTGKHELFERTRFDWTLGYTGSLFENPDQRSRVYTTPRRGNQVDAQGNILWEEPYSVDGVGNSMRWRRVFTYMPEKTRTLAWNLTQDLRIGQFKPVIKAGMYFEKRNREFSFRGAVLNAGPQNSSYYLYYATPEGSFDAFSNLKAGYLAVDLPFTPQLKLYGGVRLEDYLVNVKGASWATTGPYVGSVTVDQQKVNLLPSANLTYSISQKQQVRLAYSKTLNRAEFREMSPSYYFDMTLFQTILGNPDLAPQSNIQNGDLRYEWYPSASEMLSFGFFYKFLDSPAEMYATDLGGSGNSYFWGNARNATVYGSELELMLSMDRFIKGGSWWAKQAQKFSLMANATYTLGSLKMRDSITLFGNTFNIADDIVRKRLLYGQSHYMVNAGLNFNDADRGAKATLSYNIIGKRIVNVGTRNNPNVWEMPRHSLDFTFFKTIARNLEIRGGVQNLLNSRFEFLQDANYDGKIDKNPDMTIYRNADGTIVYGPRDNRYKSWYDGAYYTLGIVYQVR